MSGIAAPAAPLELLREVLEREYGAAVGDPRPLAGEHDRNLRFTDADGARWVAKLSDGSAAPAVAWQEALLEHLEGAPLEFAVPRIRPTLAGERQAQLAVGDRTGILRVLSWVDGGLLQAQPTPGRALLRSIGRTSAALTTALAGLEVAAAPPRHHWLVEDSLASFDAATGGTAADPALLDRLGEVRAAFAAIAPGISALPQGVVHQDLHDENLLVAPGGERIAGVIDFNDAFPTARVADLAVAGAYGMLRQDDPVAALAEVAAGWLERRGLDAGERRALLPMAAMRLAMNWATWAQRGADTGETGGAGDAGEAGESYGAGRSRFTRPALERLLDEGIEAAATRLGARLSAAADD